MDLVMETFKHEIYILLAAVAGFVLSHLRDRLATYLKESTGTDGTIDRLVGEAEEKYKNTEKSGKHKKSYVIDKLKDDLKSKGVSIAKRILLFGLGKVNKSVEGAVKRYING